MNGLENNARAMNQTAESSLRGAGNAQQRAARRAGRGAEECVRTEISPATLA